MTDSETAKQPGPVLYDRKARWSDCDAQGIVYNPTYLIYWDDAFSDYMDAIGLPWNEMTARGDDVVLARAEIDYRSSARMGQVIRTSARVVKVGNSSITFEYRTVNAANGDLLAEGRQIQVIVDHDTMRQAARVCVTSKATVQANESDLFRAVRDGVLSWDKVSELGDVILGDAPGRTAPDEITLFKLQGLGIMDLAVGLRVYEALKDSASVQRI